MAISVEDVQTEVVETRGGDRPEPRPTSPHAPDMDRIRLELRRDLARQQRLWTD
jgi:hypothetical protein